jgi:CubicO group peptidase (beta-lactamase class C family)
MRALLGGILVLGSAFAGADAIDDYVTGKMEKEHMPGVVFAVVGPNDEVIVREYGFANLEKQEKMRSRSIHRIASLSKQMTSYVALSLVDEGKLRLDDPVLKWVPKGPEHWKGITIRHLMSHTSGIADPKGFEYTTDYSFDDYVELIGKAKLDADPGTVFRYNNYAYGLLGEILGFAGGSPLPELAKKHIFLPLRMESTGYYVKGQQLADAVLSYQWEKDHYLVPNQDRPRAFHGSGGVHASLDDMVRYEIGLRRGILKQSRLDQQWTKSFPAFSRYGFGWYVGDGNLNHTGTTFSYTSAYYRDTEEKWSVILFRNSNPGDQMGMATEILRMVRVSRLADSLRAMSRPTNFW